MSEYFSGSPKSTASTGKSIFGDLAKSMTTPDSGYQPGTRSWSPGGSSTSSVGDKGQRVYNSRFTNRNRTTPGAGRGPAVGGRRVTPAGRSPTGEDGGSGIAGLSFLGRPGGSGDDDEDGPTDGYDEDEDLDEEQIKQRRELRGGEVRVNENEELPPELEHIFYEYMKGTDNKLGINYEVSSSDMDEIDQFLATAYLESRKTSDNTYKAILETQAYKRVQIPQPRTLSEILLTTVPEIPTDVHHVYAKELGERTWEVLGKNIYMNESQKRYMSQQIATQSQKYIDFTEKRLAFEAALAASGKPRVYPMPLEDSLEIFQKINADRKSSDSSNTNDSDNQANKKDSKKQPAAGKTAAKGKEQDQPPKKLSNEEMMILLSQDLIFRKEFRKGLTYMEEQMQKESGMNYTFVEDDLYEQEETNWEQEAVIDEDDLFNSSSPPVPPAAS